MEIEQLVPLDPTATVGGLIEDLKVARGSTSRPFSSQIMTFCQTISERMFQDSECKSFPELQALAFFMRKAAIVRLHEDFAREQTDAGSPTVCVPHGLVFHIPPANVDTLFVYSWVLAALCGNNSVIRISQKRTPQTQLLCSILNQVLELVPECRQSLRVISYGHNDDMTKLISSYCDLRVIWGGDETVAHLRRLPLPPHARDLVFPDRYSFSVLDTDSYLALSQADRAGLASRFFNDAYWFDQLGCSSPRTVIWRGAQWRQAASGFWQALLDEIRRRNYVLDTGSSLAKLAHSYGAMIDLPVAECFEESNELMVLTSEAPLLFRRVCAGGLFFQCGVRDLLEIVPLLERQDQTLTYFGIAREELIELAFVANGKGIDRMVPIGEALQFSRWWDGFDFLQEYCRQIHIP